MKHSVYALPLALLLVTGIASAAEPIEGQFTVTGTVPTESFTVIDPANWMSQTQTLEWNSVGTSFVRFEEKLLLRSTVGAITAHLAVPAELVSGENVIPMRVAINGHDLSETPKTVLPAVNAEPGRLVNFLTTIDHTVSPKIVPGDYAGTFSLMFETAPPL